MGCYCVRVAVRDAGLFHFLSWTKPKLQYRDGKIVGIDWRLISGTPHGDDIALFDYENITVLTYRLMGEE